MKMCVQTVSCWKSDNHQVIQNYCTLIYGRISLNFNSQTCPSFSLFHNEHLSYHAGLDLTKELRCTCFHGKAKHQQWRTWRPKNVCLLVFVFKLDTKFFYSFTPYNIKVFRVPNPQNKSSLKLKDRASGFIYHVDRVKRFSLLNTFVLLKNKK